MTGPFTKRRRRHRCAIVGALYMAGDATGAQIAETAGLHYGSVYPDLAYLEGQGVIEYRCGNYRLKSES